jgi:hypothetical protein
MINVKLINPVAMAADSSEITNINVIHTKPKIAGIPIRVKSKLPIARVCFIQVGNIPADKSIHSLPVF